MSLDLLQSGLKVNSTLRKLRLDVVGSFGEEFLQVVHEDNYALDTFFLTTDEKLIPVILRNRTLKSESRFKVVILAHYIAQSHTAFDVLPREIWLLILKHVTHPGMDPLDDIVDRIFQTYK